jgi:hypothetical protein
MIHTIAFFLAPVLSLVVLFSLLILVHMHTHKAGPKAQSSTEAYSKLLLVQLVLALATLTCSIIAIVSPS